MTKPRVISMERLSYINRSEFYVRLDRFFDIFTASIICVSPSLRNEVIQRAQLPESKVKAIPHGFHLQLQKTPHLDLLRRAKGRIVIGCVARVTPVKRQRLLLRALKILKDQFHEPFYLVIAGDSSEDLMLQDYVGSLGLTDDVWIMGHYSKVEEIYSTLDLFVLPTACEGFGRSWAEAMAYSIPVITTNIPPMSDYLTHDLNSILVSVDNEYELQAAILRLIKDSVLRTKIGKAGRALVELQFSFDNQIQKYLFEFTGR
jgi:glycosyltransferase involved in cell wall biosynthesis